MEGSRSWEEKKRESICHQGTRLQVCNKGIGMGARKHLFGETAGRKRTHTDDDFVTPPPPPKRASLLDKGKRLADPVSSGEGADELLVQKRYSNKIFQLIMDNSPSVEEEMLRKLGFDDLIHQGMTSVFRVNTL